MSLSKVNSIIPDKYQMSLEPMYTTKRETTKQWRTTRTAVNPEVGTQTQLLDQKDWFMMRKVQADRNPGITNYKNWKSKQAKYVSVSTATRVRKNMVLKM